MSDENTGETAAETDFQSASCRLCSRHPRVAACIGGLFVVAAATLFLATDIAATTAERIAIENFHDAQLKNLVSSGRRFEANGVTYRVGYERPTVRNDAGQNCVLLIARAIENEPGLLSIKPKEIVADSCRRPSSILELLARFVRVI